MYDDKKKYCWINRTTWLFVALKTVELEALISENSSKIAIISSTAKAAFKLILQKNTTAH